MMSLVTVVGVVVFMLVVSLMPAVALMSAVALVSAVVFRLFVTAMAGVRVVCHAHIAMA